jgi:hypothetical protein
MFSRHGGAAGAKFMNLHIVSIYFVPPARSCCRALICSCGVNAPQFWSCVAMVAEMIVLAARGFASLLTSTRSRVPCLTFGGDAIARSALAAEKTGSCSAKLGTFLHAVPIARLRPRTVPLKDPTLAAEKDEGTPLPQCLFRVRPRLLAVTKSALLSKVPLTWTSC